MYDRFRSAEGEIHLHPEELVDALLTLFLGNTNLSITVKVKSLQFPDRYHHLTFQRFYIPSDSPPPEMDLSERLEEQRAEMFELIRAEWGDLEEDDTDVEHFFPDAFQYVLRSPFVVNESMSVEDSEGSTEVSSDQTDEVESST